MIYEFAGTKGCLYSKFEPSSEMENCWTVIILESVFAERTSCNCQQISSGRSSAPLHTWRAETKFYNRTLKSLADQTAGGRRGRSELSVSGKVSR